MSDHAITLDQQISELRREIGMRERLYPGWIDKGSLTQATADKQVACLRASLEILEEVKAAGITIPGSFSRLRTTNGLER